VGDGPERAVLARRHPEFIWAGVRRGDELAAHYASADLFIFPSVTETFGNVVTEAMASGLVVVAFDYASAREHLREGVNGYTVPLPDQRGFVAKVGEVAGRPRRLARDQEPGPGDDPGDHLGCRHRPVCGAARGVADEAMIFRVPGAHIRRHSGLAPE
jgi:glycosyltransferase involved in cell wall biosynthesis